MAEGWGSIIVGTRLEKQVDSKFVEDWSKLISQGLRRGDGFIIMTDRVAHVASNDMVRKFLKTKGDSLLMVDSDAGFSVESLSALRDWEPGWKYDCLQAFYCRRGWPPEAIWFKRTSLGDLYSMAIYEEDVTDDVAIVGTHFCLIRRIVFEKLLGNDDPEKHDWFYYPRGAPTSEDAAFSGDALAAGFRLGATSHVKTEHITSTRIGWETYHDYLNITGTTEFMKEYDQVCAMVAAYSGESKEAVWAKALHAGDILKKWEGGKNPDQARAYYGEDDNGYLYNLLAWNFSSTYQNIIAKLRDVKNKRVLVVGPGIGGEVNVLYEHNRVSAFELPGVLRDFCKMRFGKSVNLLEGDSILEAELAHYDLVVMVDVVEHIHPREFRETMDKLNDHLETGGVFYIHANFEQQDVFPMHYDNSAAFQAWVDDNDLKKDGEFIWRKSL